MNSFRSPNRFFSQILSLASQIVAYPLKIGLRPLNYGQSDYFRDFITVQPFNMLGDFLEKPFLGFHEDNIFLSLIDFALLPKAGGYWPENICTCNKLFL